MGKIENKQAQIEALAELHEKLEDEAEMIDTKLSEDRENLSKYTIAVLESQYASLKRIMEMLEEMSDEI